MHALTNCCNSVINHGNGLRSHFYDTLKYINPRKWSRPDQGAGLLVPIRLPRVSFFLHVHILVIKHIWGTVLYMFCIISVFSIIVNIKHIDKIPSIEVVKFEFAFSCILFFRFEVLASQSSDGAWLIPWFRHFIRPLSKRRAWNLNIADMLSQANPFICNYGRKDFPDLFAYSNTHFKDVNPWKSTWDYWKFTLTVKFHLFMNSFLTPVERAQWRKNDDEWWNITEPHAKYKFYCVVILVPYC